MIQLETLPSNSGQISALSDFGMIGSSSIMNVLRKRIKRIAASSEPVLICGETGTGKELVARAIYEVHNTLQNQRNGPFVAVNCATLGPHLLGSELFGHEKGAFTGAHTRNPGLIASAHNGTLFLDEIGELPLESQAMVLRALEEREVRPIGSTQSHPVNVRLLAATHRNLPFEIEAGRFREDLYWRLKTIKIEVPPLRARLEDIPELVEHFLSRQQIKVSPEVMSAFGRNEWPGNVRQLKACINSMVVEAEGVQLESSDLPPSLFGNNLPERTKVGQAHPRAQEVTTYFASKSIMPLHEIEKNAISRAIDLCSKDLKVAASCLGIGTSTLYRKLKNYGWKY